MCRNWGYERLHKMIERRAMSEMKHAGKLIARILFLEGRPTVSGLVKVNIGSEVPGMHSNDLKTEETAIKGYTESIRLTLEVSDNGTRQLLQEILKDEESHIDELEAQLAQIEQMGPQNYLVEQLHGEK
jgi:bacterioferritin